jgi:hypothetical protein
VLGVKSSGLLETKEPRKFPIEFDGPSRDTDSFDITVPDGYLVDDVPPAVDADYGFASYHAKTAVRHPDPLQPHNGGERVERAGKPCR